MISVNDEAREILGDQGEIFEWSSDYDPALFKLLLHGKDGHQPRVGRTTFINEILAELAF